MVILLLRVTMRDVRRKRMKFAALGECLGVPSAQVLSLWIIKVVVPSTRSAACPLFVDVTSRQVHGA